jgi:ribonuclease HI
MRPSWWSKPARVYVDAKILNMHDKTLKREAYVGYLVDGTGEHKVKEVEATESDDAEVLAILFAIDELKDRLGRLIVVCDHESVVSEALRVEVKKPSELMEKLRTALRENGKSVTLEVLKANPAHGIVTEYVNSARSAER